MKKLLIVGAGGLGRELAGYVRALHEAPRDWEFAGFLDDNPEALARYAHHGSVCGSVREYAATGDELLLLGVGDPRFKQATVEALRARGARFFTLVHPTALVGPAVTLGEGCVLCPHTCVTTDATLGAFVTLNVQSTVGHDVVVGDYVTLSAHCDLTGRSRVERGAFLGSGARVLPSAVVGEFARVGAGSVVLRRVAPGATVLGVPARVISSG